MKKIFTLLATVLVGATMFAQDAVTATWTLGVKPTDAGIAGVTTENSDLSAMQTKGSNATNGSVRTQKPSTGNIPMSTWKQTVNGAYNADTYVDFTVTPGSREFTPSKVEFDAAAAKTGNLRIDIYAINGSTKTALGTKITPTRGNEKETDDADKNFHQSYTISGIEKTLEPVTIRIYFYSSNSADTSSRELCLANVVVSGTVEPDNGDLREKINLSWSPAAVELKVRDNFTSPTLVNEKNVAVIYSAEGTSATVSEDGVISLVEGALGKTVVTASFDGDDNYKPATATCTINVLTNVVVDNQPAPYTVGEPIEVAALYKGEKAVTAGASLLSDDNIEVTAPFASKLGNAKKNYLGQNFANSIQVRAKEAPSAENPNGTENAGSTTLSVTPKTNLTLVVFGRRQTVEQTDLMTSVDDVDNNVITETHYWGYQPNDGKSLKTVCTEAPDVLLDNEIVLGAFDGKDYAYVAVKLQLEAGKTYTLFALGTTYQVNGIGYILPEPEAPEAPTHTETSDDNGSTFTFTYAEGLNLYYRYVVDTETPAPAAAPTEGAAETLEHEGETYNLLKTESLTFNNKGTLYYLVHNPVTDARSEVQTVNVNGTTAIVEIGAEAEAAEYYNLQGVRVANPESGLYIRKQGNTVTKVVL